MRGYYTGKLEGERLRQCYEVAPPRVRRYLEAEIRFALEHVTPGNSILELGCGYGRVTERLAEIAARVVGIDTSPGSLALAREQAGPRSEYREMDALDLAFADDEFDLVLCVQNGICAFAVDREALVHEALRVTRPGGWALFSTYAAHFWEDRLAWFEAQSAAGLMGPIDYGQTGEGTIVCTDGFRSGLMTPEEWEELAAKCGVSAEIIEVDNSSVWCRFKKTAPRKSPHPGG